MVVALVHLKSTEKEARIDRKPVTAFMALFRPLPPAQCPMPDARREAFTASDDGFELAEADLRQRGPGDLLGVRQAGLARLFSHAGFDSELLAAARKDAAECLRSLDRPELRSLRRAVERAGAATAALAGA